MISNVDEWPSLALSRLALLEAVPVEGVSFPMANLWTVLEAIWSDDTAQDIAEYAVMLAVILVIVVGTIKLIGGKSNNVFSQVASSLPN
jgi:Flp pilus assembly pilin Flp